MISLDAHYLYIMILTLIQVTGFLIFIDYYLRFKQSRFLAIATGWLLNILGSLSFLAIMQTEIMMVLISLDPFMLELAFTVTSIPFVLGTLSIGLGMVSYFTDVRLDVVGVAYVAFALTPLIFLILVDSSTAALVNQIEEISVYGFLVYIGLKHRNQVLGFSKSSYALFMVGAVFSLGVTLVMQIKEFQILDLTVMLYFGFQIWLSLILVLFLIHLEHHISLQDKFLLKDAFSHEVAQYMQLAVGQLDLAELADERGQYQDIQKTILQASDLLHRIRKL